MNKNRNNTKKGLVMLGVSVSLTASLILTGFTYIEEKIDLIKLESAIVLENEEEEPSLEEQLDNLQVKLDSLEQQYNELAARLDKTIESKEKIESEAKAKQEEERKAKEQKAKEEAERKAKAEAEKKKYKEVEANISFYTNLPSENGGYSVTSQGHKHKSTTIAAPKDIAFGTKIDCGEYGVKIIDDRGGAITYDSKGRMKLDVFVPRQSGESDSAYKQRVNNMGRKYITVKIYN